MDRKERNKQAAARSRANRKAQYEQMEKLVTSLLAEVSDLKKQNDKLKMELFSQAVAAVPPEPYSFTIMESEQWMETTGGFFKD
jgi:hypothetical protein